MENSFLNADASIASAQEFIAKYAGERKIKFHLFIQFICILRRGNSVSSKEGTAKSPLILFSSYPLRRCGKKNASRDAATLAMQRGWAAVLRVAQKTG